uniref:Glycosyltransferase 61 catalytic domain-containing protein n=1 Tax=Oryza punctata TaxID=4537 RepID=A0A0E0JTS1_ORYPU
MASKLPDLRSLGGGGGGVEDGGGGGKKWPGFVQFFFVLSVVLCVLLYAPRFIVLTPTYGLDFFPQPPPNTSTRLVGQDGGGGEGNAGDVVVLDNQLHSPCSSLAGDTICCDRSDFNTDVCFMAGDVRTDPSSLSLVLFPQQPPAANATVEEKIRPYTRKWETFIMSKVEEVRLRMAPPEEEPGHRCDVRHDAPLLVMTAGGYTGNLFHAFSDGFVPAWLTVQHLRRRVVLGVLSYNPWWAGTFGEIISGLSDYHVVDLLHDKRTHCFPGAIVGTRFHGILSVDPARLRDNKTIVDFHDLLANVYETAEDTVVVPQLESTTTARRPRLGIVSRRGTRVIENQAAVAQLARSVGFDVDILETANGLPLPASYASVSACDVLVGVHGADLTKFLFLRPGAALVQIAPLGVPPIARGCYAEASARMGLHYEQYDAEGHESSLSRKYGLRDVVVSDPEAAKRDKGWGFVARVYLGGQNVTLDLARFRHTLTRMHARALRVRSLQAAP